MATIPSGIGEHVDFQKSGWYVLTGFTVIYHDY